MVNTLIDDFSLVIKSELGRKGEPIAVEIFL